MAQRHRIVARVLQGTPLLEWAYSPHEWEAIARTRTGLPARGPILDPTPPNTAADVIVDWLRMHANLREAMEPDVLFTTTGVVFADTARLWRGRFRRLARAQVHDGLPAKLVLRFTGVLGLFPDTLSIPIPEGLIEDVTALAETVLQIARTPAVRPPADMKTDLG